ncbi:MAG: GNAT family protein [Eubacteriales bacterium]|nr:GNAT family protein [Eubacteriales bacterium]
MKLIGFISYNSVSDEGNLSMGHVWLTAYQDNSLDTEALSIMMQYAFEKMGVNKIFNTNPLECEEQIAPLKSIGMEITETGEASFVNDENGNPIKFTFCRMMMTKEQWEASNPEGYSPKNKPEILNMMEQNSVTMSDIITGLQAGGEPPMLTEIRELFEGMKGHNNYELPDCLKFIFEHLGDYDELDFWDISALSGDTAAQVYNHNITTSCSYSVSAYLTGREHIDYMFDAFGYGYEYITAEQFNTDTALYLRKAIEYINNGIPVLVKTNLNDIPAWHSDVGTYCLIVGVGYENEKAVLKLLVGGTVPINYDLTGEDKIDLIFIGEKQREVTIEEI